MEAIKKKLTSRVVVERIPLGVFLLVLGIGLAFSAIRNFYGYLTASGSVFDVSVDELSDGAWYEGDNNYLIVGYADDDYGSYYITQLESGEFIGFYVLKNRVEEADALVEAFWEYMEDESVGAPEGALTGKGYLQKMSDEERYYYDLCLKEIGFEEEDMEYVAYYTFHQVSPFRAIADADRELVSVLGALSILIALMLIVPVLTGSHLRKLRKELKKNNVSEEKLSADMERARREKKVWVGDKYILFFDSAPALIVYDKLVWAYKHVVTTYRNGIPTSKSYALVFVDSENQQRNVSVKKEAEADEFLQMILSKAPYIFCGYDQELARLRNSDFQAMRNKVEENKLTTSGNY